MLPDFSINIAGDNQSVMFFDAATCASVVGTIDVVQNVVIYYFIVMYLQVKSVGTQHILSPVIMNVLFVIVSVLAM